MLIYKTLETKANHPEYHLTHLKPQEDLKNELIELGYINHYDFKFINDSGYNMKQVIRLVKSKIKKDSVAFDIIKKYLITEDMFNKLEDNMYYPMIKHIIPTEV